MPPLTMGPLFDLFFQQCFPLGQHIAPKLVDFAKGYLDSAQERPEILGPNFHAARGYFGFSPRRPIRVSEGARGNLKNWIFRAGMSYPYPMGHSVSKVLNLFAFIPECLEIEGRFQI
ncbi:hypothetical protein [Hypericibacter terrae]|uniref:hypothetical protein n=1 Tax=Hypericibacter terrae TaxID=2602015 RepID=UPI0012447FCF|nr:hypothetical protein [Hypericibacter terrae]